MSIFKKIFLVAFSLICISFSMCYAIDENQLTQNSSNPVVATPNQSTTGNTNSTNAVDNTNAVDSFTQTVTSAAEPTTDNTSVSSTREHASTTVSSVSAGSNKSTVTNILNIALIVVGVLLILLAIAIIIRLH